MSLICFEKIYKEFPDGFRVSDVSFEVEDKGVYGFLGKALSGKTVLSKMIALSYMEDGGVIKYKDEPVSSSEKQRASIRKRIGYAPEKCFFDGRFTVFEILDLTGKAKGVDPDKRYRQTREALELVGMGEKRDTLVGELSLSEKKRLGIANAIVGNPEIIVMDEPLRSLDASSANDVRTLIGRLGKKRCVIVFSERPSEIEELCQNVSILHNGSVRFSGCVDEVLKAVDGSAADGLASVLEAFCEEADDDDCI